MQTLAAIVSNFRDDDRIFISGASGEPRALTRYLHDNAQNLPRLSIYNSFLPGVNPIGLAQASAKVSEYPIFPRTGYSGAKSAASPLPKNNVHFRSRAYSAANTFLSEQNYDWVFVQLTKVGPTGEYSLAPSAEFLPAVLKSARRKIGLINAKLPYCAAALKFKASAFDALIEVDGDPVTYFPGDIDETSTRIAQNIASLIGDGSTLQMGLGKIPSQLSFALGGHKNLRLHSGLLSDNLLSLRDSQALDENFVHTTCCVMGSAELYDALPTFDNLIIRGVDETHKPETLKAIDNMVAVNSAIEVDVSGQANLETIGERLVSNIGGAADFAPIAAKSKHGKSIIALPATSKKGQKSRITTQVSTVSLRNDLIDYVVTEFGIAELTGKSELEKQVAMISIAHPSFQDALNETASKISR